MSFIHLIGKFNPRKVAIPCDFWGEADRGITVDESANITALVDQSGNARNMVPNADHKPVLVANAMNGYPVIRFSQSILLWSTPIPQRSIVTAFTVFDIGPAGSYRQIVDPSSTNNYALYFNTTTPTIYKTGTPAAVAWGSAVADKAIICWKINRATGVCSIAVNGADPVSGNLTMDNNGAYTWAGLGRTVYIEGAGLNGDLSLAVLYNGAISDVDYQRFIRFYARKYGITLA